MIPKLATAMFLLFTGLVGAAVHATFFSQTVSTHEYGNPFVLHAMPVCNNKSCVEAPGCKANTGHNCDQPCDCAQACNICGS